MITNTISIMISKTIIINLATSLLLKVLDICGIPLPVLSSSSSTMVKEKMESLWLGLSAMSGDQRLSLSRARRKLCLEQDGKASWWSVVCTGTLHLFLRTQRPVTRESFKLAVTLMSHTNTYKQTISPLVKMTTDIVKIKRDVNNTHECCAIIRNQNNGICCCRSLLFHENGCQKNAKTPN